jgi:hypothetical protein
MIVESVAIIASKIASIVYVKFNLAVKTIFHLSLTLDTYQQYLYRVVTNVSYLSKASDFILAKSESLSLDS